MTDRKKDMAIKEACQSPAEEDRKRKDIFTKTEVKNANAAGDGTTGRHDGEHNAFETDDQPPHLQGGDQY